MWLAALLFSSSCGTGLGGGRLVGREQVVLHYCCLVDVRPSCKTFRPSLRPIRIVLLRSVGRSADRRTSIRSIAIFYSEIVYPGPRVVGVPVVSVSDRRRGHTDLRVAPVREIDGRLGPGPEI